MGKKYAPISERDLADKLVNIPDAEIEQYHKKRKRKQLFFYLIAVTFGIVAAITIFIDNIWLTVIISFAGLGFLAVGRFDRLRWQRTYHYLKYTREKRQDVIEEKNKEKMSKGFKYHAMEKKKEKKSTSNSQK